jgi:hypothetical protein
VSYIPSNTSASTTNGLRSWLVQELNRIANGFTVAAQTTTVPVITAEPSKPIIGQVVFADGTAWNPGQGRGLYYYDSAWTKIA